jgi:DME family drug/metabolite transporter
VALGAALLLLAVRLAAGSAPLRLARGPLAVGGLGVAGYQLCFFAAVHDIGVAVGTVAALGSAPAFAGLGGWLVDRTMPGSARAVVTALAAVGVALIALSGSAEDVSLPGVVLALGAGAAYAVFTLASKRSSMRAPPSTANCIARAAASISGPRGVALVVAAGGCGRPPSGVVGWLG